MWPHVASGAIATESINIFSPIHLAYYAEPEGTYTCAWVWMCGCVGVSGWVCMYEWVCECAWQVQVGLRVPTPLSGRDGQSSCELLALLQEFAGIGSECLLNAQAAWPRQVSVTS